MKLFIFDGHHVFHVIAESVDAAREIMRRVIEKGGLAARLSEYQRDVWLKQIQNDEPIELEINKGTVVFAAGVLGRDFDGDRAVLVYPCLGEGGRGQ